MPKEIGGPSIHLTWNELACKDGTVYPEIWRRDRAVVLAETFEIIRFFSGEKPLTIHSGYRTPAYNKKVGGVAHSQHLEGRAIDIAPPKGVTSLEFYKHILKIAQFYHAIRGIGLYDTFVHVDNRPATQLVKWDYRNDKSHGLEA
jgi:uncharacterized protein YcbK (DUF882 family)